MKRIEHELYRLTATNIAGRVAKINSSINVKSAWENKYKELFITLDRCDSEADILPVYDRPFLLVSEPAKTILSAYENDIKFRKCVISEEKHGIIEAAYLVKAPEMHCLHSESEVFQIGVVKKVIIDRKKTEGKKVFQIGKLLAQYLIIDIEVIEALIHASAWPFGFTRMEVR